MVKVCLTQIYLFINATTSHIFSDQCIIYAKKKQNCGVDKLFDNNSGTYWSANFENNETIQSYVNIVFAKDSTIESILMDTADRTRDVENVKVRYYDGFPTTFDVYSAGCNDLTFMHQATFKEEPEYPISLKISYYM